MSALRGRRIRSACTTAFRSLRTFAYVETREPLLVYGDNNTQRIRDNQEEEFNFDDSSYIAEAMRSGKGIFNDTPQPMFTTYF